MRILRFLVVLVTLLPAAVYADAGRIKHAAGAVHIERDGQRMPAAVDSVVRAGDTIVTGPSGSVGITFTDNSRTSLGPNSTFTVERYSFDPATHAGRMDASLKRGTLALVSGRLVKQTPGAMTVKTSAVVLGVRGTELLVYAE